MNKVFYYAVRSIRPEVFCNRGSLKDFTKFTENHLSQGLFFNKVSGLRPATLLKKETLTQVFSFEFCEIFQSTYLYRTSVVASSGCLIHFMTLASFYIR